MQPNQEEGPDPSTWAPTMNLATQAIDDWQPDSSPEPFMSHAPRAGVKDKPKKGVKDWREVQRPVPHVDYVPRWCRFCEIVKPDRTHHCRHCGTCVMQFDRKFPMLCRGLTGRSLPMDRAMRGMGKP